MQFKSSLLVSMFLGLFAIGARAADPGTLTVDTTTPGAKIGPLFYGLMTEEINHAYDGGLYAELIQNRIFQDGDEPVCWSVVQPNNSAGNIAIDETNPVNVRALKRSLRLDITNADDKNPVGIANTGFWGIPVLPNTKYHASFYAKSGNGFAGPLTVSIQSNDGATVFASASVPTVGADWKKYDVDLTTADAAKSTKNQFVISTASKGSVWFSLVSLFPPTYHNRPNGNRVDIMEKLADMHPEFLRFPGGNFLEGDTIATRFQWKQTIGPLEDRPGHVGCWGKPKAYRVSDGLGLLEFLEWCEDLKMEPLLAVYAGYSLRGEHVTAGPDMDLFVQEALEEIEYCTGDQTTTWGKRRAADGHPDPFVIHYVEIGNEDFFDKSGSYDGRFGQMFDAIKAKYPELKCIATTNVKSRVPDLYDDHAYPHHPQMLQKTHQYDNPDPKRPKVFFGEWATQDGRPTPTMRAALDDAAWLTGLQRDSDTVLMNCYAPLFVNVNKNASQWPTNLIGYDAATSFGSPSYYAQSMFARSWGDVNLPVTVSTRQADLPPVSASHGGIGVGTWLTTAEFKDVKVIEGDQTLLASDFGAGLKGWKPTDGSWEAKDGVLSQTDIAAKPHMLAGDVGWQDYTLELKARKTGGAEGFLILFHTGDGKQFLWFNVGGWKNTKAGIESVQKNTGSAIGEAVPFKVENDRWYDIKIECKGVDIKCYVDDKLIVQATEAAAKPPETLYASASRVDSSGEIILKVVNVVNVAQTMEINLPGAASISKDATIEVLQGDPAVQNTVDQPTKIAPVAATLDDAGTKFTHEFPANSVTVIRLKP